MVINQQLINYDTYFNTIDSSKIILNDLDYYQHADQELINNKLITTYDLGVQIDNIASCDCGNVKGNYRTGSLCSVCGSTCKKIMDNTDPLIWIRCFDNEHRFINLAIWNMFSRLLGSGFLKARTTEKPATFDWMRYLADSSYPLKGNTVGEHISTIMRDVMGNKRDYPTLARNLDNIIEVLRYTKRYKDKDLSYYKDVLDTYRKDIFSTYIPIISKNLFVEEKVSKIRNVTLAAGGIVDVIKVVLKWATIARVHDIPNNKLSMVTSVVLSKLTSTLNSYFGKFLAQKTGLFRHNIYGARSHFTFRDVIVSIQGKHKYNDIYPPMIVMVTVFRPHIMNKLLKRGYTYREANLIYFESCKKFNPTVDEILTELIQETPNKGIPCIMHRNPSLQQGSAQLVYIRDYKRDLLDKTCSVSTLIIKQPNGDFDGDELNFIPLLDHDLEEAMQTFSPHFGALDVKDLYNVNSKFLTLLSPGTSILSNYLSFQEGSNNETDDIVKEFRTI